MLVATPAGITLAPEGGAHQSISTPLIGMGQPGLISFEPAYADELATIMKWGFEYMQADDGGSVYLRLSTRVINQPDRVMTTELEKDILKGAYWAIEPKHDTPLAIVYTGPVIPEVLDAFNTLKEDIPGLGLLSITSSDRLYHEWQKSLTNSSNRLPSHIVSLLSKLEKNAAIITVQDGHPASLSWLGAASRRKVYSLGLTEFGQSGNLPDLYHTYGIDSDAIIQMAAKASIEAASSV
jgi:pyruvate dehydrogenase E1 component